MRAYDEIDLAEAQFLGFNHANQFTDDLTGLADSMALTLDELEDIVSRYPHTLSHDQVEELRDHLAEEEA